MKSTTTTSVLFLLLFNLSRAVITYDIGEKFDRKNVSTSKEADDTMLRRIEEDMLLLNKSTGSIRDKRALGILLQGFMEALGYTVSPIQLASLPNPAQMTATPAPAAPAAGGAMIPAMMARQQASMPPPPGMMMMNASASAPARQRETLRFTGVFNFGNSENTTNLINHLSRYEQMFHGNRSTPPAAMPAPAQPMQPPATAPASNGPDIDPRFAQPLKEPLFVKIPLPIVPNLSPPQLSPPLPLDSNYDDGSYSKDNSEEYNSSSDDESESGRLKDEDDGSDDSEDVEYKNDNPEDRNYKNKKTDDENYSKSEEKPAEKDYNDSDEKKPKENVYKNNKNVENFSVEKKELHDASEVDEDGPPGGSQFNHATFVDEPNWKEEQDAKVYKIAAEQEARAEALAEKNAEREKQGEDDNHDEEEEFHRNREKEIDNANEDRDASYQKKPYYDDEDDTEKEHYDDEETDHEENGTQRNEARTQLPSPATLPISDDRDNKLKKGQILRDSYGVSLEKPGGKVDERVADYFTMFKNPQTGVYDPKRIQDYEHARISFDHSDLIDGFNRIQKEFGIPENKYEEYDLDGNSERLEHRSNSEESKERDVLQDQANCNCDKKKTEELEGALSLEKSVTKPPEGHNYGPYYSTLKYAFNPNRNDDHGIIARLTSYEKPSTLSYDDLIALVNYSKTTVNPTTSPDRLTTLNFLQEAENKEFKAWPDPFDHLYDNSERKNVVYNKPTPTVALPAPFKTAKPNNNYHMTPFGEQKDNPRYKADRQSNKLRNNQGNRKVKPSQLNVRVDHSPNYSTTQATVYDRKKNPVNNNAKLSNYQASTKSAIPSTTLSDIIRPERERMVKNRKIDRPIARTSTVRPTVKVKYTYPQRMQNHEGKVKEETTNYVAKAGKLVVSEPTPYRYNEGFDKYTELPQINTEGIRIKEYRNHVASVEVAELKRLRPEGTTQFFKYTKNLEANQ